MALLVRIYSFDGPPPPADQVEDWQGRPHPSCRPPGSPEVIRAVFDRHVPGIVWNDRGNGYVRRGSFEMHVLMPDPTAAYVSLAVDGYALAAERLRAILAEQPDWHVTWLDNRWLRDWADPAIAAVRRA